MSDTAQALPTAGGGEVDDGFTAEERAQFAQMQSEDTGPAPSEAPPVDPGAAPPVAGEQVPGPDDEDDDDDNGDAGVAAADGRPQPPAADGSKPKKRVSFGKFQRADQARIAAEEKAAKLEQNQARLDERLKIINEALSTPPASDAAPKTAAEEDPEPDPEADVFGWINWKKRDDARLRTELTELKTARQTEAADNSVATTYISDAQRFVQQEPNFPAAYEFLMANRTAELAQYYFGKDLLEGEKLTPEEEQRVIKTIVQEEKQLVEGAIKGNKSPAEQVFKLARARGFRPAPPAAAVDPAAAAAAAAGGAAKPAAAAAAAPGSLAAPAAAGAAAAGSVTDEIARIKAGTEAARSLSSGGGAPSTPLTAERLANMPEDEFNRLMETLPESQIRALMGGE
ncbi:MAG: hypothetical protein WC670_18400 [Pseudolabrys sp.]|jgi:hypothetical protein